MARQKGTLSLASNIEPSMNAPLDGRSVVNTVSDLTASGSFPYFYEGMIVSVKGNHKIYQLIGDDPTVSSNWEEVGTGSASGGGITIDATLTTGNWNTVSKQQTLSFTGYESSMGGVIGIPASATAAQKQACAEAKINIVSQSGNNFTFSCEIIPLIDLPVTLYAGGAGGSGGSGVPAGGTTGQALVKKSNADNDVEWGDVGGEAFIVTVTMDGSGNFSADKTPKELEDAIADNAIVKAYFPTYGLVLDLNVNASGNFAFSGFYIENQDDLSTSAFATILLVKDTDTTWSSINFQTIQGDDFSKEVKCETDLFDQPAIYLNDFDHEEDTTNEQDIVSPHRLTSAEMADIMSTLPGAPTQYPKYSTTEQVIGEWIDGKPLYQKTIDCGALPNATEKIVAHNINNIALITNIFGVFYSSDLGRSYCIPWTGAGSTTIATMDVDAQNIRIMVSGDRRGNGAYVTLQYTKTTD